MQVLGQEDSRHVDPSSLVVGRAVPLTLERHQAGLPIEVRYLAAPVLVGHNQEAPSLPIATRRRLLGQLDAFEEHLTRNGTIEIQATANSPRGAKHMIDGRTVPSQLTLSGNFIVRDGATLVQD